MKLALEVVGLEETIDSLLGLPAVLARDESVANISDAFRQRITAVTPVGYSGKLKQSVILEDQGDSILVGYESGVEDAGNPELDSVLKPKTRGRSVVWVQARALGDLLASEFEDFEGTAYSVLESAYREALNAGA